MTYIRLDKLRAQYKPQVPATLRKSYCIKETPFEYPADDLELVKARFPHTFGLPLITLEVPGQTEPDFFTSCTYFEESKAEEIAPKAITKAGSTKERHAMNVGVLLSGGQAPGGHNVIAGIFDALKRHSEASRLYGFLMGPGGLLKHEYKELTAGIINRYRNSGGFDMIGSDRSKIETEEQFESVLAIARELELNAIIIIGGDDSNTNAALLAEYAKSVGSALCVIGCPKTIDGDLKNQWIETSFGFDSCVKVYAELVGNIQRDCLSAKKYYHFIKLMGRSASHLTLECALMTQPTMAIISEEIKDRNLTLREIIGQIADVIVAREENGLGFGTVLIPEGLVEFLPNMAKLLDELNTVLAQQNENKEYLSEIESSRKAKDEAEHVKEIAALLSSEGAELLLSLPTDVALDLAIKRDPHGNVQVSRVPTEKLVADLVTEELHRRQEEGLYNGKFSALTHFFGYEGRCSMPSNFDASYCYALGCCAVELIHDGRTGYMSAIRNLTAHPIDWLPTGVPLTAMMDFEKREQEIKPVIGKAPVDLKGAPMRYFRHHRKKWASSVMFYYPGPLQFFGPSAVCDNTTITLRLEHGLTPFEDPSLPHEQ